MNMGPHSSEQRTLATKAEEEEHGEGYALRRPLSCNWSDWSDQGDGGADAAAAAEPRARRRRRRLVVDDETSSAVVITTNGPATKNRNVVETRQEGIYVPAFLQPLFGLEFVPYLPTPEKPSRNTGDAGDVEEIHNDTSPNTSNNSINTDDKGSYEGHCLDDTEAELEEIDESNEQQRIHEVSIEVELEQQQEQPHQEQPVSATRRKKFFHRNKDKDKAGGGGGENRKIQKAIGKTLNVIKQGRLLRTKESSPGVEDVEITPKRGPRAYVASSKGALSPLSAEASWAATTTTTTMSAADRRSNRASIEQRLQGLRALEDRARSISQRAVGIESRIVSLTAEAFELEEALSKVLNAIDNEASELTTTERELEKLNSCLKVAAVQLSASVDKIRDNGSLCGSGGDANHSGSSNNSIPPRTPTTELPDYFPSPNTTANMLRRRSYTQPEMDHKMSVKDIRGSASFDFNDHDDDKSSSGPPARRRANTDPQPPSSLPSSTSFMRVGDLELESTSSLSSSFHALDDALQKRLINHAGSDDLFLLDENIPLILCRLADLGLQIASDESSRFSPVNDTHRIVQKKKCFKEDGVPDWPFAPWHEAKDKDVLCWTGSVHHKGFGHDWPVVKARCVVRTSPRKLLDFLMDSEQLKRYNKMSQGRESVFVLQEGVDTPAEKSALGLAGDARIMQALNKPKLLPKTIEMLSLWYTKPVPDAPNAYMTVSRSVWENSSGTPKNSHSGRIRSEMLLGVNLIRPCPEGCEFTTITHVFAPGVPEMMAKRMAPTSAANMMREIQNIFAH